MESYRLEYINKFSEQINLLNNIEFDVNALDESIYKYCMTYISLHNINSVYIESTYKTKCNELLKSLNPENEYLMNALMNKEILVIDLPYIKPQILNFKQWDPIVKRLEYIDFKKNNMATTDVYQCRQCKERKCYVYQAQTRAADEPMTTYVTCTICGNKWKF